MGYLNKDGVYQPVGDYNTPKVQETLDSWGFSNEGVSEGRVKNFDPVFTDLEAYGMTDDQREAWDIANRYWTQNYNTGTERINPGDVREATHQGLGPAPNERPIYNPYMGIGAQRAADTSFSTQYSDFNPAMEAIVQASGNQYQAGAQNLYQNMATGVHNSAGANMAAGVAPEVAMSYLLGGDQAAMGLVGAGQGALMAADNAQGMMRANALQNAQSTHDAAMAAAAAQRGPMVGAARFGASNQGAIARQQAMADANRTAQLMGLQQQGIDAEQAAALGYMGIQAGTNAAYGAQDLALGAEQIALAEQLAGAGGAIDQAAAMRAGSIGTAGAAQDLADLGIQQDAQRLGNAEFYQNLGMDYSGLTGRQAVDNAGFAAEYGMKNQDHTIHVQDVNQDVTMQVEQGNANAVSKVNDLNRARDMFGFSSLSNVADNQQTMHRAYDQDRRKAVRDELNKVANNTTNNMVQSAQRNTIQTQSNLNAFGNVLSGVAGAAAQGAQTGNTRTAKRWGNE